LPNQKNYSKAFSLIELSIVILIIGILVAGVTQSSRLISRMKITSLINLTRSSVVPTIADLSLWLETTLPESFETEMADGDKVAKWLDINPISSQKIILSQTTESLKPTYIGSYFNGVPSIKFDHLSPSQLKSSVISSGNLFGVNQSTIFFVFIFTANAYSQSTAHTPTPFFWNPSSNDSKIGMHILHNQQCIYDFNTNRLTFSTPDASYSGAKKIFTFVKRPTYAEIRDNGTIMTSNSAASSIINTASTYDLRIGWVGPEYDQARYSGYIGEIIIYSRGLKIDEIRDIESYLAKKWSIKIN
jgi:prepilin-type N-terminal cleavage/methylation domain-containing protein